MLALRSRRIPPQINFRTPNPLIPWDELNLAVATESAPWPAGKLPMAAVSSFGFSGTNAHVVLAASDRELPAEPPPHAGWLVMPISARSPGSLELLTSQCIARLEDAHDDASVAALCRGFALRRGHHAYRRCAVARSGTELAQDLHRRQATASTDRNAGAGVGPRSLAFVLAGHGSRWPAAATELLELPIASTTVAEIDAAVRAHAGWSVLEEIRRGGSGPLATGDIHVTQVCTFALQVTLARLWHSLGLRPSAVVGHSMGEIAAAHIAGVLDLEQSTRLLVLRSRLLAEVAGKGLMAVAEIPHERAAALLAPYRGAIAVAGYNSPTSTILSGEAGAVRELLRKLESEAVFCRELHTDGVAGHGPLVAPLGARFAASLGELQPCEGALSFISSVTGGRLEGRRLGARYWVDNLLQPVRFADALAHLANEGCELFLELSPKPALLPAIKQVCGALRKPCLAIGSLQADQTAPEAIARGVAMLFEAGLQPDWTALYPGKHRWEAPPSYPWQRQRHWIDEIPSDSTAKVAAGTGAIPPLRAADNTAAEARLGACIAQWDDLGVRSINMTNLAPWALLPPGANAAFYLSTTANSCLVWAYLGDGKRFAESLRWLHCECAANARHLALIADESADASLTRLGLEGIPVGALHRLTGLRDFTPEASGLRRLRQQLRRYARGGGRDTVEYLPGSDRSTDLALAALIDAWQALKQRPVPAANTLKGQILGGGPLDGRRLFVTRGATGALYGAVLLTAFGKGDGYLLDLEFYGPATPAGTTESAIVRIIERLGAEGCATLSLGGSYDLSASSSSAHGVAAASFAGQLRFKRKFGAHETPLKLYCRPGQHAAVLDEVLTSLLRNSPAAPHTRAAVSLGPACSEPDEAVIHPFLHRRLDLAGGGALFEARVSAEHPLVSQHRVGARRMMPGAALIEMSLAAVRWAHPACDWVLRHLALLQPLTFEVGQVHRLQLMLSPAETGEIRIELFSAGSDATQPWTKHLTTSAVPAASLIEVAPIQTEAVTPTPVDCEELYATLSAAGIELGPSYRTIRRLRRGTVTIEAEIEVPGGAVTERQGDPVIDPLLLDASLQVLAATAAMADNPILLQSVEEIRVNGRLGNRCLVTARTTSAGTGDIDVMDVNGVRVASLRGVFARAHRAQESRLQSSSSRATYVLSWPERALPDGQSVEGSCWLLCGSDETLSNGLAARLRKSGARVEVLSCTDRSHGLRDLCARNWATPPDMEHVLLLPDAAREPGAQHVSACAGSLPDLVRALGHRGGTAPPLTVWTVTRGVQAPDPRCVALADAALWGATSVLKVEHPEWRCALIDLSADMTPERAVDALAAICSTRSTEELWSITQTATRVARLEEYALREDRDWAPAPEACYVVTGWTGGIGRTLARWLIDRGARHLVLLARTLGTPETLAQIEAHARTHQAEVQAFAVNVADWESLRAVFAQAERTAAPIRGIFHAAGQVCDGLLLAQHSSDFVESLAAKASGTWNLHRLSLSLPLDVFVLFSSATTLFTPPSQAAHTAACTAMDYVARLRSSMGLPALSVGWGAWLEVGKAAALGVHNKLSRFGISGLSSHAATRALEQLMAQERAHVYVSPVDWTQWRASGGAAATTPLFSTLAPPAETGVGRKEPLMNESRPPASLQEQIVRSVAVTLMKQLDQIDTHRSLEDNGLDSIMMVELRERLERELGVVLPLIDLFREPTIESLSNRALSRVQLHRVNGAW